MQLPINLAFLRPHTSSQVVTAEFSPPHASILYSMGPTTFSTPLMPKKTLFADSSLSDAQRTNSAAFGHSPSPSFLWEHTPQSQVSWQSQQGASLGYQQEATSRENLASTSHTTNYAF